MLKIYADEHVIAALVESLRMRGVDVLTVQEQGWEGASDAALLVEALREQRVLLTMTRIFWCLLRNMLTVARFSRRSSSGLSSDAQ